MYHPYRMDLFSIYDVIKAGYMENDGKMCPLAFWGFNSLVSSWY